jgi:hypothetical protein
MLRLTKLEQAALDEICRLQFDGREVLERQLVTAEVARRENSGAGFFTYLAVDRTTAPFRTGRQVLGRVAANVEGFQQPILFLLFITDGYVDMLEGATVGDSTVGIDLANLKFVALTSSTAC